MPTQNLTENRVEKATPPAKGQVEVQDSKTPGLALRISQKGTKTYNLNYRLGGKRHRYRIGRHPGTTVEEARHLAREALNAVEHGRHPSDGDKANEPPTFRYLAEKWMEREGQTRKDANDRRRMLAWDALPLLEDKPLNEISRADLAKVVDRIADRGSPVAANRALAHLKRMMAFAVERGLLEVNPAQPLKRVAKEAPRERVLEPSEIQAVWQACGQLGTFGALVKVALLTAQRRGEVGAMRWDELSADGTTWTIPSTKAKNGRSHEVPLPCKAQELVQAQPKRGEFVFTNQQGNQLGNWGRNKARLDKLTGEAVAPWTLHDCRRSAATYLAWLGVSIEVIERLLNHSGGQFGGVAGIYNRYRYSEEIGAALDQWADYLGELVG